MVMSKQGIHLFWYQKRREKPMMASPLFCYKQPEFKASKTVIFISNNTPKGSKPGLSGSRLSVWFPDQNQILDKGN